MEQCFFEWAKSNPAGEVRTEHDKNVQLHVLKRTRNKTLRGKKERREIIRRSKRSLARGYLTGRWIRIGGREEER
jgi:hypothetical protein